MKKYAIIVAGGSGKRMGSELPKQFMLLNGKSIIDHTVDTFLAAYDDIQLIVVLPEGQGDSWQREVPEGRLQITEGGATRFASVKNGLALVNEESIIFVHDAVRCLVTTSLIQRCYEQAILKGSAIPVVPSKDSIRLSMDNGSFAYDREKVMLVQTPQTFRSNIIIPAFNTLYNKAFTDEATVVEATGVKVALIEGEDNNIKITRPIDLLIAEKILSGPAIS